MHHDDDTIDEIPTVMCKMDMSVSFTVNVALLWLPHEPLINYDLS